MVKRILSCAVMALAALSVQARENAVEGTGTKTFSYTQTYNDVTGSGECETYDLAIYVPETYAGKEVEALYFLLSDKRCLKEVSVWASTTLPAQASEAEVYVPLTTSQLKDVTNDQYSTGVTLMNPLTISSKGCYVGYSFTVSSNTSAAGETPVYCNTKEKVANALWLKTSASEGLTEWVDYGTEVGALPMLVEITGTFPNNDATIEPTFEGVYRLKNQTAYATVVLTNEGTRELKSVSYQVMSADGTLSEELTAEVSPSIRFDYSGTCSLPLPAEAHTGKELKRIVLTKANGAALTSSNQVAEGEVYTLTQLAEKRLLEEEFTGTGCGYCPRGISGMEVAARELEGRWIGAALHLYNSSDPMYPTTYAANSPYYDQSYSVKRVGRNYRGAPSCRIDRGEEVDPFQNIVAYCNQRLQEIPVASVSHLEARWESDAVIAIRSDQTFYLGEADNHYAVAYYVVADSLYDASWRQANYYSGTYSSAVDRELAKWCRGGQYGQSSVSGLYFDHVVLAGIGVEKGIEGSLAAPIVEEEAQRYETRIDLAGNKFFADEHYTPALNKKNIRVIGFILDTATGKIVNAAECEVAAQETAIDLTLADTWSEVRYDLSGRRLMAPARGLNIVRKADGQTQKVFVR